MRKIPKDPAWCTYCIVGTRPTGTHSFDPIDESGISGSGYCEHHGGKAGPKPYEGADVYEPTQWVQRVLGTKYLAWDVKLHAADSTRVWKCFGYDPRHGFWMRTVDDKGPPRQTNISERAIDRTWHQLRMTHGAWRLLELVSELGRMPFDEEAKDVDIGMAAQTLRRHAYISTEGELTDAGRSALGNDRP